ncbi:hypothetical protein T492DRAFT_492999 [Pavlovales sp. CCMP2436]|nr:hypothetical protein T492DRAFT_492999 [Pavlovales sp. CCMP2436]
MSFAPGVDGDDPFVQFTATRVPGSAAAASELLPLGLHAQPLASQLELRTLHQDALRCRKCGAYASPFCCAVRIGCRACALCGQPNAQWNLASRGDAGGSAGFATGFAEIDDYAVDYVQPSGQPGAQLGAGSGHSTASSAVFGGISSYAVETHNNAYVLLVDESSSAVQLTDLRAAIVDLLESVDQASVIGLLSFGSVVCAYDLLAAQDGECVESLVLPAGEAYSDADSVNAASAAISSSLAGIASTFLAPVHIAGAQTYRRPPSWAPLPGVRPSCSARTPHKPRH